MPTGPAVPGGWSLQRLRRAWAVDAAMPDVFAASPAERAFPGGGDWHQLRFRPGDDGDVLLGAGYPCELLHVSRRTNTVCVKFSTWPDA